MSSLGSLFPGSFSFSISFPLFSFASGFSVLMETSLEAFLDSLTGLGIRVPKAFHFACFFPPTAVLLIPLPHARFTRCLSTSSALWVVCLRLHRAILLRWYFSFFVGIFSFFPSVCQFFSPSHIAYIPDRRLFYLYDGRLCYQSFLMTMAVLVFSFPPSPTSFVW